MTPEDKGLYTVRASNSLGEAKCFSHVIVKSLSAVGETKSSDVVHLEDRHERPTFTELFCDKVVVEGEPVRFECIVKGKPAPKVGFSSSFFFNFFRKLRGVFFKFKLCFFVFEGEMAFQQ